MLPFFYRAGPTLAGLVIVDSSGSALSISGVEIGGTEYDVDFIPSNVAIPYLPTTDYWPTVSSSFATPAIAAINELLNTESVTKVGDAGAGSFHIPISFSNSWRWCGYGSINSGSTWVPGGNTWADYPTWEGTQTAIFDETPAAAPLPSTLALLFLALLAMRHRLNS